MTTGVRRSVWEDSAPAPRSFDSLQGDITVDVVILGAGITGLTAAYHLKQLGKTVAILEAHSVGSGTTGASSAHLDAHPESGARKLISDHGEESARAITMSRMAAITQIETLSGQHAEQCQFHRIPGYLYSESNSDHSELLDEQEALSKLGLSTSKASDLDLPFPVASGLRIENQARFDPLQYVRHLANLVHGDGVAIYEWTLAEWPEAGSPARVPTSRGTVSADHVLVCTHSPYVGRSSLDVRVAPYQSYLAVLRISQSLPDALFWDNQSPYHYTRRLNGNDPSHILVGGADHKTGDSDRQKAAPQALSDYIQRRYPGAQIENMWSAEFYEPIDHLPLIGPLPGNEGIMVATGYSGVGLTFGTVAGNLLAEWVREEPSELAELMSPARIKLLTGIKDFVSESADAAWHFIADRFQGDSPEAIESIASGKGHLIKRDGNLLAVYRDDQGTLHQFSPKCTHMGCVVQWNDFEKTWDCPCHGGRFTATGQRLYGPPAENLDSEQG